MKTNFLIIGGGIIGLTLSLELKKKYPNDEILIIEKEDLLGFHASGRNSGVLHAGFYYTADSLKSKFTRQGCLRWKEYIKEKGLKINNCGKLVIAKNELELEVLDVLMRRGKVNGVELYEISEIEAKKIEPQVKTFRRAIWSPTTASVDPKEIITSLVMDTQKNGIKVLCKTKFLKRESFGILTNQGEIKADFVVNAAGLYADRIAQDYGFSKRYRILPFKGLYLYSNKPAGSLKTNIYPVPNLNNPFLGVHYTLTHENKIKIGPTAIPAFWREHYQGLERFNLNECVEILAREGELFLKNSFQFRSLAFEEIKKYSKKKMVKLAGDLLEGVQPKDYEHWGKPGIRAQLLNINTNTMEMDFKYEGDSKSFHILNAVSPAFTCAIPFSEYLCSEIAKLLS